MQTIQLPAVLVATPDLSALNKRVQQGEVTLDWSQVREAPQAALHLLLAGLDLSDHAEVLGIATITDGIGEQVLAVLTRPHKKQPRPAAPVASAASAGPALWEPEAVPEEEEPEAARSGKAASPSAADGTGQLLTPPSEVALRDELEDLVMRDLLGPAGGPEEELDEGSVRDRYLIGMLAPHNLRTQPEEQDELAVAGGTGGEEGPVDQVALQALTLTPSSFGISFCVDESVTRLRIRAQWGWYKREHSAFATTEKGNPKMIWKRHPMGEKPLVITLSAGSLQTLRPEPEEQPDVMVKGLVRLTGTTWTITLFLINGQEEPDKLRDMAWLFQPQLQVEALTGAPIFCSRPLTDLPRPTADSEAAALALLYRTQVSFAMGHGVGTQVEVAPGDPTRAVRIGTSSMPRSDVPRTDAPTAEEIPELDGLLLDMKELAQLPAAALPAKLAALPLAYTRWIETQTARLDQEPDLTDHRTAATANLAACRQALLRIQEGITLLSHNQEAAQAFTFMNRAMWQQRIRTRFVEEKRRGTAVTIEAVDRPADRSWRPFQLAFILLNLPALTDLHHPDRSKAATASADLLFFPTGGGKTEAYLGLTAYTLAIRRLQGSIEGRSGEEGVAVLMRYTLRLLTLQQFQRAASLICACEMIRREEVLAGKPIWGVTPFRLGLWVGQRSTPNTTEQSEEIIKQQHDYRFRNNAIGGVGSPRQLTACPWCGSEVTITVDPVARGQGRTFVYCGDPAGACPFTARKAPAEGIPVLVVDEEIYRRLPSLLIATVDKFAQLPWNGATQMLFGQVDKQCSRHGFRSPELSDAESHPAKAGVPAAVSTVHPLLRPPDLIIQDELHLISGPLGSLVGLYESAVDTLSSWKVQGKVVRPKVIAATATIRRSTQQMQALFLRQVSVFPPPGLDIADNFFARQRTPGPETPGRRYLGICASGRRLKAALIRVYVAYLSTGAALYKRYGAAADPWMTVVGYFNSLNELGGMRRLIDDDVRSRLQKMEDRGLAKRFNLEIEELTSRKSAEDIPRVLDHLETPYLEEGKSAKGKKGVKPVDVLLATNMISVGVDVKRLGLMVVAGQPKTTAEYIQATSRVGRSHPGLVCVVFNWTRPRDLSHYEQFAHYHATFYQHVEALSVTPFAARALDRGLSALLVSYLRLHGFEFTENGKAGAVRANHPLFALAIADISERAALVTGKPEIGEGVRRELERLRDEWVRQANTTTGGQVLGYRGKKDGITVGLLQQPGPGTWQSFTCLNSLRDVEPPVNLILDTRSLGDPPTRVGTAEKGS